MARPGLTSAETGRAFQLKAVRPNVGLELRYRAKLDKLVARMQADLVKRLLAAWRDNEPEIGKLARDASPAMTMRKLMQERTRYWLKQFEDQGVELANYFAQQQQDRVDAQLQAALRRGGFAVPFKATAAQNDAYQAAIGEQVGLIKSIASEHLQEVQGLVMRSVQAGRDAGGLSKALEHRYGVTRRRAALIARDQNNKATSVFTKTRQVELGVEARWRHSAGGKTPRPDHVAFSKGLNGGPFYDPRVGALISGERIWPGEKINCHCVSISVIRGLKS